MRAAHYAIALIVASSSMATACGDATSKVGATNDGGGGGVDLTDPGAPHHYQTTASDGGSDDSDDTTEYPLVLAHGMAGFQNIGPINYFYGVADALRADGHQVFVSVVDPFNSSEARGAQLQAFIEGVIAQTGAKKVKVIAHSQGGMDIRYAATKIPDKIAAIVTIATPHHGSEIADVALGNLPGVVQDAVEVILNLYGLVVSGGSMEDARTAITEVSVEAMTAWNLQYPNQPGIAYYSIAGRSNQSAGDDSCDAVNEPLFISRWAKYNDPIDPLLALSGSILTKLYDPAPTNDGLVSVTSARWGTFLGCIPADHLDEVCQLAGDSPGAGNAFDCVQFYRELVTWMNTQGY